MTDSEQKIAAGKHLLIRHQRIKEKETLDKVDSCYKPCGIPNLSSEEKHTITKSGIGDTDSAKRMDAVTLQKKTAQFVELNGIITHLKETLSDKNEIIDALNTQIKVLREGTGDNANIGSGSENDKEMLKELRVQLDSRNTQIGQLVESLKNRSEELEDALNKEKELKHEIKSLQQDIEQKAKESEAKLTEYYNTAVNYKAKELEDALNKEKELKHEIKSLQQDIEQKMELLARKSQDLTNSELALTRNLQTNNRKLEAQEELLTKYLKLEKDKNDAVSDVKILMKQIEELNHDVVSREKELITSKQQLEILRKEMDKNVKIQAEAFKCELKEKYNEDVKNIELMYDKMMLEQIRKFKSDTQLNEMDSCIKADINSCKKMCEERNVAYIEELQNLMEKSKLTEEQLKCELNKHKQDVIYYKQQVENFENKLLQEVEKIKSECYSEINTIEDKMNVSNESFNQSHQFYRKELDRLGIQLREYAKNEALKEEEIEMYIGECKKQEQQIKDLMENLEDYKRSYGEQINKIVLLEKDLDEKNSQLKLVTHELSIERIRNEEYEEQVRCFNNKIKADSDTFNEKCQAFVQTYEKEIDTLKMEISFNKSSYSRDMQLWTDKSKDMHEKIMRLEQELTVVLGINTNSGTGSKKNNALHDVEESYRQFLIGLTGGLHHVMADMRKLTDPNKYCEYDQTHEIIDINKLNCENLKQEIEKVMRDLLAFMQKIALNVDAAVFLGPQCNFNYLKGLPSNVVTSTPITKEQANGSDRDLDKLQTGNKESVDNWMTKCAELEYENEKLAKEIKSLTVNLREMELCLTIFTQESSSFNKKCKALDGKITELEQTKLSEYLLRKENNDLKEQLAILETDQRKLHQEVMLLNENNIQLEKIFNKNILDLQNQISQSGDNEEMQGILLNLNNNSKELIRLKSELATLRISEQNQKKMTEQVKQKHKEFVAKHEFLSMELESRTNELKEIWEERNNLSSENKVLKSKLISAGIFINNTVVEGEKADDNCNGDEKGLRPLSNGCTFYYNQTFSQTPNATHNYRNHLENITNRLSISERIENQLQQLDQDLIDPLDYHMPTIPEEAEDQLEGSSQQPQVLTSVQSALHQLLGALTRHYTSQVKAFMPPLLEDGAVLDFNLLRDLDSILYKSIGTCLKSVPAFQKGGGDSISEVQPLSAAPDAAKSLVEFCVVPLFHLRRRLTLAHNAVLTTILGQRQQLKLADLTVNLQEQVDRLQEQIDQLLAEKDDLEKKHSLAIELLVRDHENELRIVKNLLADLQDNAHSRPQAEDLQEVESLKKKHHREMEKLRTYFEEKCRDMEKHYSEEMYSQSQQSCKASISSSSSDISNMADLSPAPDHHLLNQLGGESEPHPNQSLCRLCSRAVASGDNQAGDNASVDISRELELKVYQLKEEVRKDYESELDKIREDIISKELKRKDEEIEVMKRQLNEAHKVEVEKLWRQYEELATKEGEKSMIRVRNETILGQELEERTRLIEQLRADKKELVNKLKIMDHLQAELNLVKKTHVNEIETMKQAFEIERTTRVETILEEKRDVEVKFKKQVEKLQKDIKTMTLEKDNYQDIQQHELHNLTEAIRKDILRALELQIKAMVASGEDRGEVSEWPPELAALERQLSIRYQNQLTQLVEEHALEVADIRSNYEAKMAELVKEHAMDQAENTQLVIPGHFSEDEDIDKIVKERDGLRGLALTLRQVVCELTTYLTSCEDELNRSIVGELLKLASPRKVTELDSESSECESEQPSRRVHFAPDVSGLVSLLADDTITLDISCADVSVVLRSELESCLARLRADAGAVLGLSQGRDRASSLPLEIEERRLTSLTRQLIDERKAKEELSRELQDLNKAYDKCKKDLNDVYKELTETKERFIKEKVAEEAEMNERQQEEKIQHLCFLQEKARALLSEREDCPPQWLGLIEELCATGDGLIEEACRARDDLYQQVEAADKQLRSTRTFLEEQASEREQERDEYTRELAHLREQLRGRDHEWTNHREFAREVEALEQQLKESTELLNNSEEEKVKIEKELKAAIEKIWVLRDIISELEAAVATRVEREVELQAQVLQLEGDLHLAREQQANVQQDLQGSGDQRSSPQPHSPRAITNVKTQLRGLVRSLEQQVRELEAVNVHASSASLSSPSEDVSIREHLEALRCVTPDGKLSPSMSAPPLEELSQLGDKLLRYRRAADTIVKTLRDRDLHINMLNTRSEELQAEKDVLQAQNERQLLQMASLRERLEGVRARAERDSQAHTAPLLNRLREVEAREAALTDQFNDTNRKLNKMKQKLDRSESLVRSQEADLSSVAEQQHQLVLRLSQDLETMRAEKQQLQAVVEKYRSEGNVSFPQLIDVMLAEKNADIDQLQHRVEELQSQRDSVKSHQSRNPRVSFADDISNSRPMEADRARDVTYAQPHDFKHFFSTPLSAVQDEGSKLVPRLIVEDLSKIPEPSATNLSTSPNRAFQLEQALSHLKAELEENTQRLVQCEAKLAEALGEMEDAKRQYAQQTDQLAQVETELGLREEDIARTKADLRAVQLIMEGLQRKLAEARAFTLAPATQEEDNEKLLSEERSARQALQEAVTVLKQEKKNISADLATTRAKCDALQEQLTIAIAKSEQSVKEIGILKAQLEAASSENTRLDNDCQQLKRDMERMSKKQKTELKNIVSKDANEAKRLKDEIELLKCSNAELRSECESLQQDLDEVGSKLYLLRDIEGKGEKIQKLEHDLKKLDDSNRILKEEKSKTERSLNEEISELKVLIDDLNKNIVSLESEPKESKVETLTRRFEMLKRECDRQRRGRRECERKCSGLKEELAKEKRYSTSLQSESVEKRVPRLGITKANIVDIRSEAPRLASSLDDLTDEVQKELNASAKLDQSLISGLQATNEEGPASGRGRGPISQVDYLTRRLAEVETALHVEKVVVSEVRGRLARERAHHVEQRSRADTLERDVDSLHSLNDQLEHKFKSIAYRLEQQVNEVKELRLNAEPTTRASLQEKEELRKLVLDKQKTVEDLMRERTFTKNQLLYLREEVARLTNERAEQPAGQTTSDQERVQQAVESERRNAAGLKDALEQVEDLRVKLRRDVEIRKSLEAKMLAMELAEKSRYSRRKSIEETLKTLLEETEKAKRAAESECSELRIKFKNLQLQLTAHAAESPMALRLKEANTAVERLVGEKEDLNTANVLMREEKAQLTRRVSDLSDQVEQLKSHIDALNIKVTDGGSDKLLKAERAAWQQERETLLRALAFRPQYNDSFNDIAHILKRYLRAESDRAALVWQKRYLLVVLRGYQELEQGAIRTLAPFTPSPTPTNRTPTQRLRVVACVARAVSRLQFLVRHRHHSRSNTCRMLHHALTAHQHKVEKPADLQTVWRNSENISSSSLLQPGTMAQYIDQFNFMQERMKNILSSSS